jgi:hypothetical protein
MVLEEWAIHPEAMHQVGSRGFPCKKQLARNLCCHIFSCFEHGMHAAVSAATVLH